MTTLAMRGWSMAGLVLAVALLPAWGADRDKGPADKRPAGQGSAGKGSAD